MILDKLLKRRIVATAIIIKCLVVNFNLGNNSINNPKIVDVCIVDATRTNATYLSLDLNSFATIYLKPIRMIAAVNVCLLKLKQPVLKTI